MGKEVALKLANIDDQRFLPAVEEKFREVQEKLTRYAQKHGPKAVGAKAVLTVKVTLAVEKSEDPSIKAEIETKLPADPPHLSLATFGFDEHGPCLTVQRAGSFGDTPRQTRMFTDDGRLIDQETGEILEGPRPQPNPPETQPPETPERKPPEPPEETGGTPAAA